VLGVIEDLALRYKEHEIDREWVARMLAVSMIDLEVRVLWFLCFLRAFRDDPGISCEWADMVTDLRADPPSSRPRLAHLRADIREIHCQRWKHRNRKLVKNLQQQPSEPLIRLICLPPDPEKASDIEWDTAGRLTKVLAGARAQRVLCTLYSAPSRKDRNRGWRVIVVHRSIDADADEIKRDEARAESLSDRIGALSSDQIDHVIARLSR
jgi:hypothetical protein